METHWKKVRKPESGVFTLSARHGTAWTKAPVFTTQYSSRLFLVPRWRRRMKDWSQRKECGSCCGPVGGHGRVDVGVGCLHFHYGWPLKCMSQGLAWRRGEGRRKCVFIGHSLKGHKDEICFETNDANSVLKSSLALCFKLIKVLLRWCLLKIQALTAAVSGTAHFSSSATEQTLTEDTEETEFTTCLLCIRAWERWCPCLCQCLLCEYVSCAVTIEATRLRC